MEGADFLRTMSLFRDLDRRRLGKLYHSLIEMKYEPGEEIFAEGDIGKALFIIREGEVAIVKVQPDGGELTLVNLKPGAYFGELALLDELPRSAGARTATAAKLLILYKANFDGLIKVDPSIGLPVITQIARTISGQIRRMNDHLVELLLEQRKLKAELEETVIPKEDASSPVRETGRE